MQIISKILFCPTDFIYKGHFPEKAIVPGVVQLREIKHICEKELDCSLIYKSITECKYLGFIFPSDNAVDCIIDLEENENNWTIKARIIESEQIKLKLKALLIKNEK